MSAQIEINASVRETHGKAAARRMRREEGLIPAVVYGAGKAPVSLTLNHNEIIKALENEAFYSQILNLKIEGQKTKQKVVLKAVQRHVYKPKVEHLDFFRVSAKEKLTMNVPVHFLNAETCKGVKEQGGVVIHAMNEVEISCLPADLPEFIEIDLADLELNHSVHLSELKLPEGVEVVALTHGEDHDLAVVSIQMPKVVEDEPEEVEAAAEEGDATEAKADDAGAEEGDKE